MGQTAISQIINEESICFNEFYYQLALIADDETLNKFEELRKNITTNQLNQSQSVKEIISILKII